jgi:hypothetical protein
VITKQGDGIRANSDGELVNQAALPGPYAVGRTVWLDRGHAYEIRGLPIEDLGARGDGSRPVESGTIIAENGHSIHYPQASTRTSNYRQPSNP